VRTGLDKGYWEVFARHEDDEPVRHVGTVRAVDAKDARFFAHALYDEFSWKEMFVAPRSDMVPLIRPE
jgi:1,2-phenylacetyl-CoA epoxidase PaaB subunit